MASEFAGCTSTLVVQFPDEVYRSSGESVVLPELLKSVDVPKVRCVQFVRNGLVRVTFDDTACSDAALSSGIVFRGMRLPASYVSTRFRLVYVRDLPAEVPESFVQNALSSYGTVHGVFAMEYSGYPGLLNGTRLVKVTLEKDVPSSLRICDFDVRVWYRGQPQACIICRSYRHRVKECPLNGLCRRCHKPGHVARECREPRRVHEPLSTLEEFSATDDSTDRNDAVCVPTDAFEPSSSIDADEESTVSKRLLSPTATRAPLPKCPTVSVKPRDPPFSSRVVKSSDDVVKSSASSVRFNVTSTVKPRSSVSSEPIVDKSSVKQDSPVSKLRVSRAVKPSDAKQSPSDNKQTASSAQSRISAEPMEITSSDVKLITPLKLSGFSTTSLTRFPPRPPSITRHAIVFEDHDSPCGFSRIDCGSFTIDAIKDTTFFERDRYIYYVHCNISRATATILDDVPLCETLPRLRRGPAKFPVT